MHFRLSLIILIMLTLLLAGGILIEHDRGDTMTRTAHPVKTDITIPPVDRDAPAITETATFALG